MAKTYEAKGSVVPEQNVVPITGPQHEVPAEVDPLLVTILSWPRPHLSFAELRFRAWLSAQINARLEGFTVQYLAEGVMYCTVADNAGKPSTTLFSCHIDTVDAALEGEAVEVEGTQRHKAKSLTYDPNFGIIALDSKSTVGTCLGADDGAGVWLMLKMLDAKVPGGYMFHTGEERGGIGSRAVLVKHADILKKYEVAVAFDRPRNNEVITHQGGDKCASQKFAESMCTKLNAFGFDYKPSNGGTFTDTKIYRGVIAECANLGVGYVSQHGRSETQDYAHLNALCEALIKLDWLSLPVDRDPLEPDPRPAYTPSSFGGVYRGNYSRDTLFDDDEWGDWRKGKTEKKTKAKDKLPPAYVPSGSVFDDMYATSLEDLAYFAESAPEEMAESVQDLLIEIAALRGEVMVLRKKKHTH